GECYISPERDTIEASIPTTAHTNHAPALAELDNGDLLCVWFGGSDEGAGDIKVHMSRLPSKGAAWSQPILLSQDYSKADQNPSLFQEPSGRLWLLHTSMETRGCTLSEWQRRLAAEEATGPFAMQHTSNVVVRTSDDRGLSWGTARPFIDRPGTFCRHPISILSDGTWIFPVWYSSLDSTNQFGHDHTAVYLSSDGGASWSEHSVPKSAGRVHGSVVELDDGRLLMFLRSRSADRIYLSRSGDSGRTWSEPERTELPNNNASIRAIRLRSRRIAIIFNNCSAGDDPNATIWPYERVPVTVALSEDEGATWPWKRHLEAGDNYAGEQNRELNRRYEYPFIIQSSDGMLHAAFAFGNRKYIKYLSFSEEWVRGDASNPWPWKNFPVG
ncbi:MAG TPA: sialidase family protein, partial [Spirochaetia bacterium]|nr:sialidase family protein [Spirochaetia bacterium]